MNTFKKAAMFGLDARIALAIFGSLSVISGAALYSAIQNLKVTQIITSMREFGKAWDAYYLDTRKPLPMRGTSSSDLYRYEVNDLYEDNGVKGWKGPYIDPNLSVLNSYNIYQVNDKNTWGGPVTTWAGNAAGYCQAGQDCFAWVLVKGISDLSIVEAIDERVDGSDGPTVGDFKYYYLNDSSHYRLWLKHAPVKNPNG
tara:strand:+ start:610 stop:1206 length:597 start_codon:yes stop_codon:yes gene_type:complete